MAKLLKLLLEAELTPDKAKEILGKGVVVSLFYNKKWVKNVLPTKISTKGGEKYIEADVKDADGGIEKTSFKLKDVSNWVLSTKTSLEDESKKPKEKPKQPTTPKASSNPIVDDVNNKRVISIYYMGDKQNKPGWRTILPVAYGSHSSDTYGNKDYIRAWQWKGDSVRGIPKWKLFRVDRVRNWNRSSTQTVTDVPDPRYNPKGDKWMDQIYAFATFGNVQENKKKRKKKKLKEEVTKLVNSIIKN